VDAQTALSIGLVNQVVPAEQLMDTCMEMAKKIGSKGPLAVKLAKKVIDKGIEARLNEGSEIESREFGECFASGQAKEGMSAFLEKKKPNW
jgi:enoyl-CoA hydratase